MFDMSMLTHDGKHFESDEHFDECMGFNVSMDVSMKGVSTLNCISENLVIMGESDLNNLWSLIRSAGTISVERCMI